MMEVAITDRCAGHGRCYTLAPELFEDDEAGFGVVKGDGTVSGNLESAVRDAAQACPEYAIRLSR
jgi:ferredoxin